VVTHWGCRNRHRLQPQSQSNPGVYLIANDQPLAVREWLPALLDGWNAPPPPQVSVGDALKRDGGADVVYSDARRIGMPGKTRTEFSACWNGSLRPP